MATRRSLKQISALKKTRRYRDHVRSTQRKMQLERLEDRRVMATTGPTLVNVLSNFGPITADATVSIAPREITLRFAEGQMIDPATIANGVRVTRGGLDRTLGSLDDVVIQPGWIGPADAPREIIIRFADNLPDDLYRIDLIGTGLTPLTDTAGNPVNGGQDVQHTFNLDLGAQIVAIVPQPITRNPITGKLDQRFDQIEVYFNPDLMDPASVTNPAYYKLIDTATGNIVLPTGVTYTVVPGTSTQPGEYKATLTFEDPIPDGTFKLRAGVTDEPNGSITTAMHVAGPVNSAQKHKFSTLFLGDNPALANASADVDFYRFDVRTAGTFNATVAGGPGFNAALRLFDSNGVEIGLPVDANGAGGSENITLSLMPGTYYLGVSASGNVAYLADGTGVVAGDSTGSYKLDATFPNVAPLENNGNDSSFGNAGNLGVLGLAGQTISANLAPQFYDITWPGNSDDPGHRDLPPEPTGEEHLGPLPGPDGVQGIQVMTFNFPIIYGQTPQMNDLRNAISGNQKQRAYEIFELYGRYLGIKFVKVDDNGFADIGVVTGDMRAIDPTIPTGAGGVAGLAGSGLAIMDNAEAWDSSAYGGAWFNVALHEIGHLLGLGHSYDLPALTIQGSAETPDTTPGATNVAEPVFPGDHDILHGQTLYRPEGRDIDLYKFQVTEPGRFSAETIAERLSDRPGFHSSQANTVITLYREFQDNNQTVREVISRNDDYYSSDSFLEIDLLPGTYYVSVTSTGMTGIDPTVLDSGFGGTTDGAYELQLNFTPAAGDSMRDATGTRFDGDLDGRAGGAYEFFFQSNTVPGSTIYVDKANSTTSGPDGTGTLNNPFDSINQALAAATSGQIVRIVGNGGTDGNLRTLQDNRPYLVGYDDINNPLADGFDFLVPQGVTVMIDAGTIIKLQRANLDAGTSTQGISRAGGVIQILGTPVNNVQLTSYSDDTIGGNTDGEGVAAAAGDWGGIVFRDDSDREGENIFLNYVNHAAISYGGGKVVVNSTEELFNPIHISTSRPTITFNRITFSAHAAMSADPDSFQDTIATGAGVSVAGVESRIGPEIYGNAVITNSFNGMFVRIRTEFGEAVDKLNTYARFDDIDIVHMISENLHINGTPGGPERIGVRDIARTDARLRVDPGMIVKFNGTRIEALVGSQLIVEGSDVLPVIFTSLADDKYGVGGTFDTSNDANQTFPAPGDWGGLMFNANSSGSIDQARVFYAGGEVPIFGDQATFNPVEIHQADVRIARSLFQFNASGVGNDGIDGTRNGRGNNSPATIFVRGAQPIIVDNVIRDNAGNIISINANSMQATVHADYGRATGGVSRYTTLGDNYGPLVRLNRIVNNETNGMEVRGSVLTTETIWDDTDIAHVVRDQITILNQHTFGGLRLQSSVAESLVVKLFGPNAGFLANGVPMEIGDRIGGTLHIIGQPNRPVVLTSLADDTVPSGLQPLTGLPLFDTNNDGSATTAQPGDWNSIRLDQYSNDRNVGIVLETEPAFIGARNLTSGAPAGDSNRIPLTTAQFLGNLAPHEKAGDDNRRLGFEVQGFIALDNSRDVDVYSFTADGGTEVWFDIDRTSYGLNTVIELVDANGTMLARSRANDDLTSTPFVTALTFQKDPHLGRDFYTVNPNDASMRVILPGTQKGVKYFIRVRSEGAPADINNINAGLTRGEYRLQVRVRQVDNKPGSTVRYSDIRYATNGIEVIGLPYHSPIGGESTEANEAVSPNNVFSQAQYLGNLLTSDRGTIKVAGTLSGEGDVDFYSFDLDYDFIQVIEGVSDAAKTISTMFDIDYADGLSRPDTTISVFDDEGRLIFIGRDSDIEDDQPGAGQGIDSDDLARGSFGKLDPYIGTAQLPAGSAGTAGLPNPQTRRYYVAISSNRRLPRALDAQFQANAASPLIRLEPINSVRRIVEDHLDYTNGSAMAQGAGAPMFDISTIQTLATHIRTFDFSDATLFTTGGNGLRQIDPFTGATEVGQYGGNNFVRDIVMRNDGRLFGYRMVPNGDPTTAGQLVEWDSTANTWVSRGNDNIANPPQGNTDPDLRVVPDVGALAFTGSTVDGGNHQLWYAVDGGVDFITGATFSWLYHAHPETGNVRDGNGPLGFAGNITTASTASGTANFGAAQLNFAAAAPGPGGNAIQIDFANSPLGVGRAPEVVVNGSVITVTLNSTVATAQANNALGSSVNFQFVAVPAGAAGNGIQLSISKAANVPNGVNATVNGRVINVVIDNANATAQQFADAVNGAAGALVNVTFTGVPTTNIGVTAPAAGTITLQGGSPSSAQDVIDAINAHVGATPAETATNLISVSGTGNLRANAVPFTPQSVQLTGGDGQVSETKGLAYLDGVMYGVSEAGEFFRLGGFGGGPAATITTFPVSFTGLTVGPQNVEQGRYSDMLFATTTSGQIMAFDTNGVLQDVFSNGTSSTSSAVSSGLAFSPLDFNLWHTTQFREFELGHGVNNSPDNSRPATTLGGTSFYFGLEAWTNNPGDNTYYPMGADGSTNAQLGIVEPIFQHMLTNSRTNTTMTNTYNFAGTAYGSLETDGFSLQGYKATDKPTMYFNYWLDTEGRQSANNGGMRDAARVWISSDNGLTWELIATNNSQLDNPGTFVVDGELPTFKSTSSTELPLNTRQHVQELFDVADWRQARIDLSRYAGRANLKFRFDFNTSGDTTLGTIEGAFGNENHFERGRDNQHGGFAIDDIIVGFAERGEMVTRASPNLVDFFAQPTPIAPPHTGPTPNEVLMGSYQLEIRRGTDYGVNVDNGSSVIGLYGTYDTNARLVEDVREAPPLPVQDFQTGVFSNLRWGHFNEAPWTIVESPIGSGELRAESGAISDSESSTLELTADVGAGTITFDWGVSSEFGFDFLEFYVDGVLFDAISGELPTTSTSYTITAGVHNFRWHYVKDGSISSGFDRGWVDNIEFSNGAQVGHGQLGDENHWRDQGHIQIEQNLITDSELVGILVDGAVRNVAGTHLPFQGSVQKMMVPNVDNLLPGVALVNNTVGGYGTAGIHFSGDPNVNGQATAASPFGRIINNTVYGGPTPQGTGILVTNNAAPTIINNIIANAATAIGIDPSSAAKTVVAFNAFAGNLALGTQGSDVVIIGPDEPLFVNPSTRNFYLASGSRAIDSSLNALGERPSYHAVIAELGIPDSPILAPDFDMYGQKRLDDVTQNPAPGQGTNIVKDRGAIERADFTGAFVHLIRPLDNDGDGLDRNTDLNDVVISGTPPIPEFVLKLADTGIGIDDLAITSSQFVITKDGVLVPDTEYLFVYNPNTDEVSFKPGSGAWEDESTYVITVDNSAATGVKDLAGNTIQPNRADGSTMFTIFIGTPYDYSDAAATYPVARHILSNELYLGAGVSAEAAPHLPGEDNDDGLNTNNYQLNPGKASTMEVVSSDVGKLDVWIDLNADGDFDDADEYITGASFDVVAGVNTLSFVMPDGNLGNTTMRLRLTTAGLGTLDGPATPGGDAPDGEVEDYEITLSGPPFQNPNDDGEGDNFSRDVNGDGTITALDALIIINYLNLLGSGTSLPHPLLPDAGVIPNARYVDVDGSTTIDNQDALIVINWLNANPIGPSGEGEGAIPDTTYASSSIVIEERVAEVDAGEVADELLASDAAFAGSAGGDQAWDGDELFNALGQDESEDEDELISVLAYNLDLTDSDEA